METTSIDMITKMKTKSLQRDTKGGVKNKHNEIEQRQNGQIHPLKKIFEIKRPMKVDLNKNQQISNGRTYCNQNKLKDSTFMYQRCNSFKETATSRSKFYSDFLNNDKNESSGQIDQNQINNQKLMEPQNYVNHVKEKLSQLSMEEVKKNNFCLKNSEEQDKAQIIVKKFANNEENNKNDNQDAKFVEDHLESISCSKVILKNNAIEEQIFKNSDNIETHGKYPIDFGLNEFDENNIEDNYVTETYNDPGNELILVYIQVKRKSINIGDNANWNDLIKEIMQNSDMAFHEESSSIKTLKLESNKVNNIRESTATDDSGIEKDIDYIASSNVIFPLGANIKEIPSITGWECAVNPFGNVKNQKMCSDNQPLILVNLKNKSSYIIEELLNTEEQYLLGLEKIVMVYKPYIEDNISKSLKERISYIFGNVESIYRETQKFYHKLKEANNDIYKVVDAFINNKSLFELYPHYSKNKPTADFYMKEFDFIIKERQQQLGDRLDLASYLLTPIQRLGKYILILENIDKDLNKRKILLPNIKSAIEIVRNQMKKGNDFIAVDSIKNCPINLIGKGTCVMRQMFSMVKPKKMETMVFLFEHIIVFTHTTPKNLEKFLYFDSIDLNDLIIATFETNPLMFQLLDHPKCKQGQTERYTFVLEAKTPKIKCQWTEDIERRLWQQLINARQHQKDLLVSQEQRQTYKVNTLSVKSKKKFKKRSKSTSTIH